MNHTKKQIEDDCVSTSISNTAGFCTHTDLKSQLHHPLGSKTLPLRSRGCRLQTLWQRQRNKPAAQQIKPRVLGTFPAHQIQPRNAELTLPKSGNSSPTASNMLLISRLCDLCSSPNGISPPFRRNKLPCILNCFYYSPVIISMTFACTILACLSPGHYF